MKHKPTSRERRAALSLLFIIAIALLVIALSKITGEKTSGGGTSLPIPEKIETLSTDSLKDGKKIKSGDKKNKKSKNKRKGEVESQSSSKSLIAPSPLDNPIPITSN